MSNNKFYTTRELTKFSTNFTKISPKKIVVLLLNNKKPQGGAIRPPRQVIGLSPLGRNFEKSKEEEKIRGGQTTEKEVHLNKKKIRAKISSCCIFSIDIHILGTIYLRISLLARFKKKSVIRFDSALLNLTRENLGFLVENFQTLKRGPAQIIPAYWIVVSPEAQTIQI